MAIEFYFEAPADTDLETLIEAFATMYKYPETILDPETEEEIPNPVSKEDFMIEKVSNYIGEIVAGFRAKQYDQGLVSTEEYILGRKNYVDVIKAKAKERIKINKRVVA